MRCIRRLSLRSPRRIDVHTLGTLTALLGIIAASVGTGERPNSPSRYFSPEFTALVRDRDDAITGKAARRESFGTIHISGKRFSGIANLEELLQLVMRNRPLCRESRNFNDCLNRPPSDRCFFRFSPRQARVPLLFLKRIPRHINPGIHNLLCPPRIV